MRRIVVKIGGSILFATHSLDSLVTAIVKEYRDSSLFFIVGGGDLIEAMRTLQRLRPEFEEHWLHWKCIELLDTTWEAACKIAPSLAPIQNARQLQSACTNPESRGYWVRVSSFYDESSQERLSHEFRPSANWDTTTDALAWYLAFQIQASEVLLIKSCELTPGLTIAEAAQEGIVDREIERLSRTSPDIAIRLYSAFEKSFKPNSF